MPDVILLDAIEPYWEYTGIVVNKSEFRVSTSCGDDVGERLGAKQAMPPKSGWLAEQTLGLQNKLPILSFFASRHHDGISGCGWGGVVSVAVEMIPLPTL